MVGSPGTGTTNLIGILRSLGRHSEEFEGLLRGLPRIFATSSAGSCEIPQGVCDEPHEETSSGTVVVV